MYGVAGSASFVSPSGLHCIFQAPLSASVAVLRCFAASHALCLGRPTASLTVSDLESNLVYCSSKYDCFPQKSQESPLSKCEKRVFSTSSGIDHLLIL